MQTIMFTFPSQTTAYRFQKEALKQKIPVRLIRTPKEISVGGCSYGIVAHRSQKEALITTAQQNNIPYKRIIAEFTDVNGNTFYREIY